MDWASVVLSIVVGVGTGVLANFATYLFVNVWLPKYRDIVYQGIRIDGDWVIVQNDTPVDGIVLSSKWALSARLEQRAYILSGHATANRVENGESIDAINYNVAGYIYDRFVVLTFRNNSQTRIAHSVFLVEVRGDGRRMIGYRTFYGLYKETIRVVECMWQGGGHGPASRATDTTQGTVAEEEPQRSGAQPGA